MSESSTTAATQQGHLRSVGTRDYEEPDAALAPLTEAQAARLIDRLPAMQPEVSALTSLVLQWDDHVPVGLGAHGAAHQLVESVAVSDIWVDPDLYVHTEADEADISDDDLNNLLSSFRSHTVTDDVGIIRQATFAPLLLIARPNPERPRRQRLMLLRDLQTYEAARRLKWSHVEAVVYPDISDRDIRNIGLHLALRSSPPSRIEVLRQLIEMDASNLTQVELGKLLGCTQSYISRLTRVLQDPHLARLIRERVVPVKVAIRVVDLINNDEERDEALRHIIDQCLSVRDANTYLVERAREMRATGSRTPTAPEDIADAFTRSIERSSRIALEHADELASVFGEGAVSEVMRKLQDVMAALAQLKAVRGPIIEADVQIVEALTTPQQSREPQHHVQR